MPYLVAPARGMVRRVSWGNRLSHGWRSLRWKQGSGAPHPDGSARATIFELQAIEASLGPKPDGSCIRTVDADMRCPDSLLRGEGHPLREEHRSSATSLSSLQQVQMQMRRIEFDNLLRGTLRVIDSVCAALVRRPFGRRPRSRIGVLPAKLRPPFGLKSLLPFLGVRRTDANPATPSSSSTTSASLGSRRA
jgi:hypothetical protein